MWHLKCMSSYWFICNLPPLEHIFLTISTCFLARRNLLGKQILIGISYCYFRVRLFGSFQRLEMDSAFLLQRDLISALITHNRGKSKSRMRSQRCGGVYWSCRCRKSCWLGPRQMGISHGSHFPSAYLLLFHMSNNKHTNCLCESLWKLNWKQRDFFPFFLMVFNPCDLLRVTQHRAASC